MIVGIHQPEYLPWLGFFDKMDQCDVFVLLDTVQFRKNYFQNRNRIRVNYNDRTWRWLTVPIAKGHLTQLIKDVQISNARDWGKEHLRCLELHYRKAPFFNRYKEAFKTIYGKKYMGLSELNIELIFTVRGLMGIDSKVLIASKLDLDERGKGGTEVVFNICKHLGATSYLSGQFGKDYLDENVFYNSGITLKYQDFHHPVYKQVYEPFVPSMSSIDLLFNEGEKALKIIREANNRETD